MRLAPQVSYGPQHTCEVSNNKDSYVKQGLVKMGLNIQLRGIGINKYPGEPLPHAMCTV